MAALVADLPGHFSVDSVAQLAQGRSGLYDDWHPPLMAWLLGLAAHAAPGAALFVAADASLFFASLVVLAAGGPRPRIAGLAVLGLIALSPQALIFQGIVWKDILFADLTLAAFAALAAAGGLARGGAPRAACFAVAFVACLAAALVRQIGFVTPIVAAAVFLALEGRGDRRALARAALIAGLALAALVALMALISTAFAEHSNGRRGAEAQLAMLQAFDLAGAERLDPALPLPGLHRRQPALERFVRVEAAAGYRAATIDFLDGLPGAPSLLPPSRGAAAEDWTSLILRHPWLYASVRAQVFWATLATPDADECPLVSVGVQTDDDSALADAGLTRRLTARDRWDEDYAWSFYGTPVLSHLFWGTLALLLLMLAARDVARGDRRPAVLACIGLLCTALAYVAGFFLVSVACDYRYFYMLDVAAMAALAQRASARPFVQAARPTTAVARRSSLPQPTR